MNRSSSCRDTTTPLVSVVTISYNQAAFLRSCIMSVLQQSYARLEYIVIDAGSTDGSLEILRSFNDNRFTYASGPDRGPADGLNKGFARATGDLYYYLNADDVILPDALAQVVAYMALHPSIDVVTGNAYRIDSAGQRHGIMYSSPWSLRRYIYGGVSAIQPATFFRREAYTRTNGFNIQNRTCWDGELVLDMALTGSSFRYLDRELACFRIHPDSITGSGRTNAQYQIDSKSLRERVFGVQAGFLVIILLSWYRAMRHLRHPLRTLDRLAQAWVRPATN